MHDRRRFSRLILAGLLLCGAVAARESAAQAWSFVSSPDLFNSDIADLSGGTVADINNTFPDPAAYAGAMSGLSALAFTSFGRNSLTSGMAAVYNDLFAEMQANAGGNATTFLVAGDLINGRWPQTSNGLITNFGGGNTSGAIDNAADIYFAFHRELARQHGFTQYLGAIGDHDIGDNDWSVGSSRANHVDDMKRAFGRTMVDPLGLPATWNGLSSTAPAGLGEYDEGSFVKQENNVLFVTVDVFRWEGGGVSQHPWFGAVTPEVTGTVGDANTHLGWLDAVLTAADNDPTVDHVILQGHTPVLSGVRKQSSSGMMMQQRDDSAFWQVLQAHDQQNGGKVRMYFGGEVHTTTATKDPESDVVQLVHGNPPLGSGGSNYIVFNVDGKKIEANLYNVDLDGGGGDYWQVSKGATGGVGGISPGEITGTLTIDASGPETTYETSGFLDFVRNRGVLAHYSFDETTETDQFSNTGSLRDLFYAGNRNGGATEAPGKLGKAVALDGQGDYVRTAGGLAPISESEQRTVAAWINTTDSGEMAIFGYGQDNRANGEFNLRIDDGVLKLNIDSGFDALANNPAINDGEWHHVAVVLPGAHNNTLGDVLFYVDGVQYASNTSDPGRVVRTFAGSQSNLHVGANAENLSSGQHFNGLLDDVALWGAPLDQTRIRSIANAGNDDNLRLDTLDMESLFALFDDQQGAVDAGGYTWTYTTGLAGGGGDVLQLGQLQYGIVLDDIGGGVLGNANLILLVDRNSGEVSIRNRGGQTVSLDGYTIASDGGYLNPADGQWNSLFDQATPGWIEANPLANRLSEVKLDGDDTLAPEAVVALGMPYQPSPTAFGEPIEDLEFTYVNAAGEERTGLVRYVGDAVNNLALIIDPTTGEAVLRNASGFDVQLEGYSIISEVEPLDTGGWTSLQDASEAGWIEANPTSERLNEVNIDGATLVAAGEEFAMGDLFAGDAPEGNVLLRFWLAGDDLPAGRVGHVLYQSLLAPSLAGDFNRDGVVDAADFAVWRDSLGMNEASLGANGDGSGVVDAGDYDLWRQNYGAVAGSPAVTPEPTTAILAITAGAAILAIQSRRSAEATPARAAMGTEESRVRVFPSRE